MWLSGLKLPFVTPISGTQIRMQAAMFLIQLLVNGTGKAEEDGPSTLALAVHAGDQDGVPGLSFGLAQPGILSAFGE